jgi:hypothetical protein
VASKIREAFPSLKKYDHPVAQGDPRLLSFDMSDAAAHYGVRSDVVPKRTRMGQGGETNA